MRVPGDIERLLSEAATAAVAQEIPIEVFALAARAAYLRAEPAFAAQLRDRELLEAIEELRRDGRLPVA